MTFGVGRNALHSIGVPLNITDVVAALEPLEILPFYHIELEVLDMPPQVEMRNPIVTQLVYKIIIMV